MRIQIPIGPMAFGLLIFVFAGAAQAADEWRRAVPGDPLYEAKQRIERAELEAARDPLERSAVHVRHADRRLEEIQSSAAQGRPEHMDELVERHGAALDDAAGEIERARGEGRDVGHALETVEQATSKHTEVLTGLLDKVPEQARPAIQRAIEKSRHGHDTATARLGSARAEDDGHGSAGASRRAARMDPAGESGGPSFDHGMGRGGFDPSGRGLDSTRPGGFGGSHGAPGGPAPRGPR